MHVVWRVRGFAGDKLLLPVMLALCGIGLMLMISLRDPLRDALLFTDFAEGVIAGCVALIVFSIPDYERHFRKLSYVPLLAAFLLALALGLFGSGPGTSDAKVNLFFFQPVEIIRILIVFFLAGYFAQNWDALRHLKQRQWPAAHNGCAPEHSPARLCSARIGRRCAFDCALLLVERSRTGSGDRMSFPRHVQHRAKSCSPRIGRTRFHHPRVCDRIRSPDIRIRCASVSRCGCLPGTIAFTAATS